MLTLTEYTGELRGGPDDGNYVTTSIERIPVVATVDLYLDGKGPDKIVTQTVIEGNYVWNSDANFFGWDMHSVAYYKRKPEV